MVRVKFWKHSAISSYTERVNERRIKVAKQKTKTKAKRHVNIFCIAPNSDASQREKFGIGLALKGIRAKCFTEDDARLDGEH